MEKIVQAMFEMAAKRESFVLATVISRNGSAPRSEGAKMLVRKDRSFTGTVGGGTLEAQVQQLAYRVNENHLAEIRSFSFSGKDASTMDAICGGEVEVLVEWFDAGDPFTVELIHNLYEILAARRKGWLLTALDPHSQKTSHVLQFAEGTLFGKLPAGLTAETVAGTRSMEFSVKEGMGIVVEPVNIVGTTFIFGAGHVSQSLADFAKAVGFWTVVLDDRAEFCNRQRFQSADELIVLDSYEGVMEKLRIDHNSFIVIVTRGHMNDREVLAQALKTDAGYIGMIGSRRKCQLVYEELYKQGFTDQDTQRVHAPIGLAIKAETPEEIGVSICAEMIQVRAEMQEK